MNDPHPLANPYAARLAAVAGACGAGLLLRLAYRLAEPLGLGLSPKT